MSKANGSIDLKSLKVAGSSATSYITTIDDGGIKVHDAGDLTNYTQIDSSGIKIFQNSLSVAEFGTSVRIGMENNASIILGQDLIMGRGKDGITYFNFRNSGSTLEVSVNKAKSFSTFPRSLNEAEPLDVDSFLYGTISVDISVENYDEQEVYEGWENTSFSYGVTETKNITIYVDHYQNKRLKETIPYVMTCKYDSNNSTILVYSSELWDANLGGGIQTFYKESKMAPGYSLGVGTPNGGYSLATGYNTTTNGKYSYAGGWGSTATGDYSHAEGFSTTANGVASYASGYGTVAGYDYQTVIGKYNQNKTTTLFEVGKGTSSSRSNAFEVDTSGNVNIASGAKYKINGNAIAASDVGAVPTTRKVNSKELSSDISLTASDVSAVSTSDVSTTGGANKVIKSNSSGNVIITGNLTLGGHTTSIGSTLTATNSADVSISAGGTKTLATLSNLPIGTWVIECNIRFSNEANGIRRGGLLASGSNLGTSNMDFQVGAATTASFIKQTFTKVITTTAITTYNLIGYSSVAVAVGAGEANIKAVRLC